MSPRRKPAPLRVAAKIRCAIYTRKSSEEGLDQDFNSLDAQREAAEAFIHSQAHEGWLCLPTRYDDGGFTGGNMDRPALQHLLRDIQAGRVDLVLCYKVDRLSRSLLDFARMMECFDQQRVSFVSVTQQFNTTSSLGRLTLNILLSFAQFEREIISERTRDKMGAARRKGKWLGGSPCLGYDVAAGSKRLVLNALEAEQVRAIFGLYLEYGALLPVVQELTRRGWVNKRWVTRQGQVRGGRSFTKTSLRELLSNVVYAGKVRYRGEVYAGEQPALVDPDTWQRVQARLEDNRQATRPGIVQQPGVGQQALALLAGLLFCGPCGCAMTPAQASKRGRRYRYYVCTNAQKRGRRVCPSPSVPLAEMERFVLEQLPEWERPGVSALLEHEQLRLVQNRVERVLYDGANGKVAITFRSQESTGPFNGASNR